MRKTLMIFLALVLVCGCGAALAAQAVSAPREEILFQEHIFSGDPAAADGIPAVTFILLSTLHFLPADIHSQADPFPHLYHYFSTVHNTFFLLFHNILQVL